jgi:hypothetical protein
MNIKAMQCMYICIFITPYKYFVANSNPGLSILEVEAVSPGPRGKQVGAGVNVIIMRLVFEEKNNHVLGKIINYLEIW